MLVTCVNDVHASTQLSSVYVEPFQLSRSFELATGTLNGGSSVTETGTFNGTLYNSTDGTTTVGITYSSTANVDTTLYGHESYLVDCSYSVYLGFGTWLSPERNYTLSIALSSLTPILTGFSGVNTDIVSQEVCVLVSGQKFYLDERYGSNIYGTGFNTNGFTLQINAKYICTTGTTIYDDYFSLGYNVGGISISVHDFGVVDGGVIDSINNSTNVQQQGNQLQQESNNLQQQENQLQAEQNQTTNNIFSSISDFFGSFFDNLIGIFVPESGYFEQYFERLNTFFSDKLGMLYAPIDIFIEVLTAISEGGGSAGIIFPQVKWQEYVLIEQRTINLQSIANELGELQEYIYLGTDVIMVGSVINLLQNKLREVLRS